MAFNEHPRRIIRNFIPVQVCKELEFIHKSNCTVGYRPNVFSTTLSHLIATNCAHLIMPFIPIREKLKEKVEEVFDCEYELFVEFTGLISWNKGASIGWHSDDNRPYLKQRDFTAVCYLNSYGQDFTGGMFHFQDGEPANYLPMAGDLVVYSADNHNIHCVDEITDGERLTLTLWFSRNSSFDEDAKLVSLLAQSNLDNESASCIPLPAPSNMYWFSLDQDFDNQRGYDICLARLFFLGFDIYTTQGRTCISEKHLIESSDVLIKPLKLAREDKLYGREFANLLHALQVVQFYVWKRPILQISEDTMDSGTITLLSEEQKEVVRELRSVFLTANQLDNTIFCDSSPGKSREFHFDWACFSVAETSLEEYTLELHKQFLMHLPFWKDYRSLFSVCSSVIEE
ncbi:hypothetical protein SOVF_097740 [Spinacia oleracea]|uniref:Fe2OG dioxygenase domain-containing protein n=1 Tax=Spinacia oleracea TaxID=3562 RepID=A0A9R0IQU8_SPIOL|nr:uncharacterized protein LOC110792399 [Spinacia oleracea]KNA15499.1 hypothetical protein SOVF_097740 [Spinacia oleracea]